MGRAAQGKHARDHCAAHIISDGQRRESRGSANEERERLVKREHLVAERERAQANVRQVQRRWFATLAGLALAVVLSTGAGLWAIFNRWRDLMTTRAQFIAGVVDQLAGKGALAGVGGRPTSSGLTLNLTRSRPALNISRSVSIITSINPSSLRRRFVIGITILNWPLLNSSGG
jgi:hypothetical protein